MDGSGHHHIDDPAERARRHCQHRAWQRFGLALHRTDILAVEEKLVAGGGRWICDCDGGRTVYAVSYRGRELIVVFEIGIWAAVTFLPSAVWALRHHTVIRERGVRGQGGR
jgi:hypothetical protein